MADETYLFIDGQYLREIHGKVMQQLFGQIPGIDLTQLKAQARAQRVFFYDCANDVQGAGETENDFHARTQAQEAYFLTIRALHGFHLRLGTLTGKRGRLRQKEVDVQLAVDMLTHGLNKNMNKAVLIAGDLDFRPIVEALVRNGVFVEVWYERASAAKDLFWAADFGRELTPQDIYAITLPHFTRANPLPRVSNNGLHHHDLHVKVGTTMGKQINYVYQGAVSKLFLPDWNGNNLLIEHENGELLERFFAIFYAPIEWRNH
jgi:uncharacterized LabA/DUF88 family protein